MLSDLRLPAGLELVRTTSVFDTQTVPPGLLSGHRVAGGVWGRLVVLEGTVTFVSEDDGERRELSAGDDQAIPPEVRHHLEPGPSARFMVEFHR